MPQGIQQLATRSMDDALRSFEGVLAEKPTNIVALLGKVCLLLATRVVYSSGCRPGYYTPEGSTYPL